MRLIDADKLIVSDKDCSGNCRDCNNHVTNCMELADLVNDAQTIDAVEVIRCENCRKRDDKWEDWEEGKVYWCDMLEGRVKADDYCSYAERRAR